MKGATDFRQGARPSLGSQVIIQLGTKAGREREGERGERERGERERGGERQREREREREGKREREREREREEGKRQAVTLKFT